MNEGTAIRLIRKRLNIKQAELAGTIGLSQTSLSQIEQNLKRPSTRTLQKICKALDIPESLIYVLGMERDDVSPARRSTYDMLFPSIANIALEIVGPQNGEGDEKAAEPAKKRAPAKKKAK
jgi:Predicted transcriptional regulators